MVHTSPPTREKKMAVSSNDLAVRSIIDLKFLGPFHVMTRRITADLSLYCELCALSTSDLQ